MQFLISRLEASKLLNVSVAQVDKLCLEGKLIKTSDGSIELMTCARYLRDQRDRYKARKPQSKSEALKDRHQKAKTQMLELNLRIKEAHYLKRSDVMRDVVLACSAMREELSDLRAKIQEQILDKKLAQQLINELDAAQERYSKLLSKPLGSAPIPECQNFSI
jgi:hypothetical protein